MKQPYAVTELFEDISALRERLGQNPGDGPAWKRLGFAMSRSVRHADAVHICEVYLTLGASARIQAIPHALSLSALNRNEDAIAILRTLQSRKRKDFELANLLGVVLKRAGRFRQAFCMFELARRLPPATFRAGRVWQHARDHGEANWCNVLVLRHNRTSAATCSGSWDVTFHSRKQASATQQMSRSGRSASTSSTLPDRNEYSAQGGEEWIR